MNRFITRTVAALLTAALISQSAFLSPVTAYAAEDESATFVSADGEFSGEEISADEASSLESTEEISTDDASDDSSDEAAKELSDEASEDNSVETLAEESADAGSDEATDAALEETSEPVAAEDEDKALFGANSGKVGDDVTYTISGNVITLTGTGATYNYDDYNNKSPFNQTKTIKSIVVSEGITEIGDCLFCEVNNSDRADNNLKSISLPTTLKKIGEGGFRATLGYAVDLVIPGSVTFIGEGAFEAHWKSITFSEGVTTINVKAVWNATTNSITLPDSLTTIEESAFGMCDVPELNIPGNVKTIGKKAFERMNTTRTGSFVGNMPSSVADDAFSEDAIVMTYPAGNSSWNDSAVKALSNRLKNVTFIKDGSSPETKCGADIVWSLNKGTLKLTGTGDMTNYAANNAAPWARYASSITALSLDSRITSIGDYSFYSLKLGAVTLPSKLTRIGHCAFTRSTITTAKLPSGVTFIGDNAFYDCRKLNIGGITFNSNLTYVGDGAFYSCRELNAKLGKLNCIEYIGKCAFDYVGKFTVTTLEFPETLKHIGDCAFMTSSTSKAKISLPSSLTYLGRYAFAANANYYGDIVIPNGITKIEDYIFQETGITGIKICDTADEIGNGVCLKCTKLKKADLGKNVKIIKSSAFEGCTALSSIEGLETVEKIWGSVFSGCTSLTSITFGENLNTLGWKVFKGSKVKTYTFTGNVPGRIDSDAFNGALTGPTVNYPRYLVSWYGITADKLSMESLNPKFVAYGDTRYFTVTFKDGTSSDSKVISTEKVELGSMIKAPAAPTKEHKIFHTWYYKGQYGTYKEYDFNSKVLSDITLYAMWNDVKHNVVLNYLIDGKVNTKTVKVAYGNYMDDPTSSCAPSSSYKCQGWSLTRDDQGKLGELINFRNYRITKDVTIYSVYKKYYMLTMKVEGSDTYIYPREPGDKIGELHYPSFKSGYDIVGWFYEPDFKTKVKETDIIDRDITVYGYFTPKQEPKPEPQPEPKPEDPAPEDPAPVDPDPVTPDPGDDEPQGPSSEEKEEGIHVELKGEPVYDFGKVCMPDEIMVYDGDKLLESGKDYTYKAVNAKNAGTAAIVVTFKGNYTGTLKENYTIYPIRLNSGIVRGDSVMAPYNGKVQKKKTAVRAYISDQSFITLKEGRDYILSYEDKMEGAYKEPGYYQITITGVGNYTGTTTTALLIQKAIDINKVTVSGVKNKPYTGEPITQDDLVLKYGKYTLVQGDLSDTKDFFVQYANNTDVGTVQMGIFGGAISNPYGDDAESDSDKPAFTGMKLITFKITGTPISKAKVEGAQGAEIYTGSEIRKSGLKLTYTASKSESPRDLNGIEKSKYDRLSSSAQRKYDYTFEYLNNVNKGTAKIIIRGVSGFTGSVTKTFTIKSLAVGLEDDYEIIAPGAEKKKTISVVLEKSVRYQKGGAKAVPTVFYKVPGKGYTQLKNGKDYTVTYTSNRKVGTAGITVTGKGNFAGKITGSYEVVAGSSNDFDITVSDVAFKKTGLNSPKVTVKDKSGKVLTNKKDYSYVIQRTNGSSVDMKKDVIAAGTQLKVIVTPLGNYAGTPKKSVAFNVYAVQISAAKVTVGDNIYVPGKSDLSYSLSYKGNPLTRGKDYAVVSTSGADKAGTAKVTIRGIGSFGGTRVITIKVAKRAAAAVNK